MKKLLVISTLTMLSFTASAYDSCQMVDAQEARINSCQQEIVQTEQGSRSLLQNIDSLERKLGPRADKIRAEKLATCETHNDKLESRAVAIKTVNKTAQGAVNTLATHKRDVEARVGGNKLINSYECVAIDPKKGNEFQIVAGKRIQPIFIGSGRTEQAAKQSMLNSAAAKGYFRESRSSRIKRLGAATRCFPVYATDKAQRALQAVNGIVAEAAKVKIPALPAAGSSTTTTTNPGNDSDRGDRGGRRGNRG